MLQYQKYCRGIGIFCLLTTLLFLEIPTGQSTSAPFTRTSRLQEPTVLREGTLSQEFFPIVFRGSDVPQLLGLWENNIRVTYYDTGWHLESFQIDERDPHQSDLVERGGYVATQPQHPHYMGDTSDSTHNLGEDDEFVFYARNGAKLSETTWWNADYLHRIEIEIQEPPGTEQGVAWMYIYYDRQVDRPWREAPAYHDYITWSGKTNDWYTVETDWYHNSCQDQNPGLQDFLRITSPGLESSVNLMKEGLKSYFEAAADLPWPVGEIHGQVREGHWNGTYYDEIVDNIGYGGSPTLQNSADGVACIDGPVRVIYFATHYYQYALMGLPVFELEFATWVVVYLRGSSTGPILATTQMGPVKYLTQLTTTCVTNVTGMKFVDASGRLGLIDGNPRTDEFSSPLNSPSQWGFYYGPFGSIWISMPYDSFVTHGGEVYLYWRDSSEWHRGEAGQATRLTPGNATWWIDPLWVFVGGAILSDSLAQTKASGYWALYTNWRNTQNFFQLTLDLHPLTPLNDARPASPLSYLSLFSKWPLLVVLVLGVGIGLVWRRLRNSKRLK